MFVRRVFILVIEFASHRKVLTKDTMEKPDLSRDEENEKKAWRRSVCYVEDFFRNSTKSQAKYDFYK